MGHERILQQVEAYYSGKFAAFGATAEGVDWNGEESQELRFVQLLRLHESDEPFTINDYGCGYGALVSYLEGRGFRFSYRGFDLSPTMLEHASRTFADRANCKFVSAVSDLEPADYTVGSGIFNVRLETKADTWRDYVLATIDRLNALSVAGFAFNMLTSYSDADRMRSDLYYGDPSFFFDHCKRTYARNVALLHDYGLYEFTVLVRKELS
jgi:SAM-dependent methyltransferase